MSHYPAPPEIPAMLADLVAANHPTLASAAVTFLVQMHESKNGLHLRGWPAAAVAKIVPEKDRTGATTPGLPDCRITIDAKTWTYLSGEKRLALLDHELQHFEAVGEMVSFDEPDPDKPDAFRKVLRFVAKIDDAGRPKIRMRPHDWECHGFRAILERHGDAALEKIEFLETADRYGQLLMEWGDSDEAGSGASVTLSVNGGKAVKLGRNLKEATRAIDRAARAATTSA